MKGAARRSSRTGHADALLPGDACIYGGATMAHLLAPALHDRAQSVLGDAGWVSAPGKWTRVGNIRFLPVLSEHAPHFRGIKVYGGHLAGPATSLPRRASGWKEGEPLAFLIDLPSSNA